MHTGSNLTGRIPHRNHAFDRKAHLPDDIVIRPQMHLPHLFLPKPPFLC